MVLAVVGLVMLTGCDTSKRQAASTASEKRLILGGSGVDHTALAWIAQEKEFFARNGLNVDIRMYESGLAATQDLLAGKLDLSMATAFVASLFSLERPDVRIIARLCEMDDIKIVARKDRQITNVSEIRHRRIGMAPGTVGEFYLDLLMALNSIPSNEVKKVALAPSEQVKAILKGEIDAVVLWEPYATSISNALASNAVIRSAQSDQSYDWLLLGTEAGIRQNAQAIRGFVSAMLSAEEFIRNQPNDAGIIVARKSGSGKSESFPKNTLFEVGLDHSLILKMESKIKWINSSRGRKDEIPDLMKLIYFDALKSERPDRIKLLH